MNENPSFLYNEYTIEKKTYYLDELFNVVTNLPYWTTSKSIEVAVINEDI